MQRADFQYSLFYEQSSLFILDLAPCIFQGNGPVEYQFTVFAIWIKIEISDTLELEVRERLLFGQELLYIAVGLYRQ